MIFKQQAQIADAVGEHGYSLHAQAKCIALKYVGVYANVVENRRMNHAATEHLQPATLTAHATTAALAFETGNIHFHRWLGEWKK